MQLYGVMRLTVIVYKVVAFRTRERGLLDASGLVTIEVERKGDANGNL